MLKTPTKRSGRCFAVIFSASPGIPSRLRALLPRMSSARLCTSCTVTGPNGSSGDHSLHGIIACVGNNPFTMASIRPWMLIPGIGRLDITKRYGLPHGSSFTKPHSSAYAACFAFFIARTSASFECLAASWHFSEPHRHLLRCPYDVYNKVECRYSCYASCII